jgi:ketosteroid isomerase-like protein
MNITSYSSLALVLLPLASTLGCADAHAESIDPVATHLELFDQLDFEAYSKQNWELFRQIHCDDVVVSDSMGNSTQGIDAHVAAMQPIFSWAPDIKVLEHPIKIGQGDYTAVTGRTHLTFTEPMSLPGGVTVPPTGKAADGLMVTVAHWRGNCIAEEQLFLPDSSLSAKQLGLQSN